ncbi:MAG: hypothetical protein H6577_19840 [Lewinellaceae bacterium]|nr:hypothetical protein [Saprospiraceae bacterium]MCB9340381.1 hypothetical protein [Lewinellaceae bacterium]
MQNKTSFVLSIGIFLIMCHLSYDGSAQTPQKSIGIYPFSNDGSSGCQAQANQYWSFTSDALNKTGRFTLVDRSRWNVADEELERQKGETFLKSEDLVEQGKRVGAQLVLQGHVQTETYSDGTKYNTLMLQLIDVESNRIIGNDVISPNGRQGWTNAFTFDKGVPDWFKKDPESSIRKHIQEFIAEYFPIEVPIVEITETNKDGNASQVLVECGENDGITKGKKLFVIERTSRTSTRTGEVENLDRMIAQINVEEVQGGTFSVCSVSKKEAAALTAKINEKANIFVTDKNMKAK